MIYYLIAFFLSFGGLFADEDSSVATLANDPSTIVGGAVNVITGELLGSEEDLTIQGAEPIHISRTYTNGSWSFGSFVLAYERSSHTWIVEEPNGGQIKYEKADTVRIDHVKYIRCTPKNLKEGFSNTAMGAISSRTNFKNNFILIEEENFRHLIVHASNGTVREYKKTPILDGDDDDNDKIGRYRLVSEHLPNSHWILYDYEEKQHNRMLLTKIRSTNASQGKVFAWAEISYEDPKQKNKNFVVKGSDGQTVRYGFGDKKGEVAFVSSSQAPDARLEYTDVIQDYSPFKLPSRHCLRAVSDPSHPRLQADYYNKSIDTVADRTVEMGDFHWFDSYTVQERVGGVDIFRTVKVERFAPGWNRGKVKTLSAPVNPDGSLRPIYSFIYWNCPLHDRDRSDQDGKVDVFDADLNRTVYAWGDDLRIQRIERYSKDGQLLNKELYRWGSGQDLANLICKSMIDADGSVISSVRYLYDARGNVIEERLYGNLSGAGASPVLDNNGLPIEKGEIYCKRYRYSSSEPNLLLEESDDSGRRIVIDYLTGTDLPISQLTYDHNELKLRKTFEYDNDRVLIREVTDDGISHTIRRITSVAQAPYIGLPQIIEELVCQNGHEELLKKTVLTYTTGAKIARQDVYGAKNVLQYSLTMAYDAKGRLIERTNAIGQTETMSYDACGNQTSWHDFSGRITQTNTYDARHWPTLIKQQGDDGIVHDRRLGYDLRSNLISDIDLGGNETKSGVLAVSVLNS